jgi:hypothetical protein
VLTIIRVQALKDIATQLTYLFDMYAQDGTNDPHCSSRPLLVLFLLTTWHDGAQAMPLTKPGMMIVETIPMEDQRRHRHHQLRRHSRQQLNHDAAPRIAS